MLLNKSTGKTVIDKVKLTKDSFGRFKGLMFEKKENFDYALIFEFDSETRLKASIHMFFVFFPIDAIYLDSEKKVIDVAHNLKPFMFNYTPKKKAKYLVELPAKLSKKLENSDILSWE